MRCKIIEIGPKDAFSTPYDIDRLRGAKGFFERHAFDKIQRKKWLQGNFVFDDPYQRALTFHQIKVEPIPAI